MLTTVSATWRLSPTPPDSDDRNSRHSGVCAESADLGPALRLWHAARVPGELDTGGDRVLAHQLQHPHPFGEDDDLALRIVEKVGQQQLDERRAGYTATMTSSSEPDLEARALFRVNRFDTCE